MFLWFIATAVFFLLIIFSMQISAFFSSELETRAIIDQLISESETHYVEELKSGPIKDFLEKINRKHNTSSDIKIFSLSGVAFVASSLTVGRFDNSTAFVVPIITRPSKSCIFVPETWLKELTEQEMQCLICHEICHVINAWKYKIMKILILSHINPWVQGLYQKIRTAEETEADLFAVKIMGREVYVEFFQKLVTKYPEMRTKTVEKRIAKLKSDT